MVPVWIQRNQGGKPHKNAENLGKFTKFALILGFLAHKINVLDSFLAPPATSLSPRPLELLMEIFEIYMNSREVLQESFFFFSMQNLTETFAFQVF